MVLSGDGKEYQGRSKYSSLTPRVSVIIPTTFKELREANLSEICAVFLSPKTEVEVLIINECKERSEQRNIGIDHARGEFILYLDSDQFVSAGLIDECVELMDNGADAVYIPEKIITKGLFARLRDFERQFYTVVGGSSEKRCGRNVSPFGAHIKKIVYMYDKQVPASPPDFDEIPRTGH